MSGPRLLFTLPRRESIQRVVVSTLAVTCAWGLGSILPGTDPIVAAILCVITLRISLQASVAEAFSQLLGVGIGAGLALATIGITGHNLVTVAATVAIASVTARLLRLGDDGWINIAVTALIVLGPGAAERTASARVWGTLVGVGVALAFAYWSHPTSPVVRTQILISDAASEIAVLLSDVATGVGAGYDTSTASGWLERARTLNDKVVAIRPQAEESVRYARWSPLASRSEAEGVFARYVSVEHTMVQARNVVRTFYDASLQNLELEPQVAQAMHEALSAASDAVEAKSSAVLLGSLVEQDPESIALLREETSEALTAVREAGDDALVMGASVIATVERLADSLDPTHPAITDVPTPPITATAADNFKAAMTTNVPIPRKRQRAKKRNGPKRDR
jgi:uncharacterized membrane protein YgaE (UPF0421/DUF939 family)